MVSTEYSINALCVADRLEKEQFPPEDPCSCAQTDENEAFYGRLIESRCTGFINVFMERGGLDASKAQ